MADVAVGGAVDDVSVHPLSNDPDSCWEAIKRERNLECSQIEPNTGEKPDGCVRFVCISDTHGHTDELDLPEGDVLLHTGDFTMVGDIDEIRKFNEFLGQQKDKFTHIIVIAGNHDLPFAGRHIRSLRMFFGHSPFVSALPKEEARALLTNCTYLEDSGCEVFGMHVYGTPWQPTHFHLAFNLGRGAALLEQWRAIPTDTDVLLCHGPPLGYGDVTKKGRHVGCAELLSTVQRRVRPRLFAFGHIHESHGTYTDGTTLFANASSCDKSYNCINPPIIVDLPVLSATAIGDGN